MNAKLLLKIFFITISITACLSGTPSDDDSQVEDTATESSTSTDIEDLVVPDGFNYQMTREINFNYTLRNDSGQVLPGVKLKIFTDDPEKGGKQISTLRTDENGNCNISASIPLTLKKLFIQYDYVGLSDGNYIDIGASAYSLKSVNTHAEVSEPTYGARYYAALDSSFEYLGGYDNQGVPDYLLDRDTIDAAFLADINASLPESKPVPQYHPDYLSSGSSANTLLLEDAEVWVTFVHEGAGYRNVFGYYTYDRDDPPESVDDIEKYTIVFPNISYVNSGGGLRSGDKVLLGSFKANTVVGYFLIANGWNGSSNNDGNQIYYSNANLNVESEESKRQHNVLLWDKDREVLLLGFEDLNREQNSDDDFNDAVFYLTVSPSTAVDVSSFLPIDTPTDTDNDGITDTYDDYPEDVTRAFDNFYPSVDQSGTLAFEDLWPKKGDYDFNDLVLEYNYKYVTNTGSDVIDIYANFKVMAIGAGFQNGFGFELPIPADKVESVEGIEINDRFITLNENNTEAGQENAVIIVADNLRKVVARPSGHMVNTQMASPYVEPVDINVVIRLTEPISLEQLGFPPYNPFLIKNRRRENEIHLSGKLPTLLADIEKFGSGHDDTNISLNKYYMTETNLPWGLNIPTKWKHMRERKSITKGYMKFKEWAESGGQLYPDWNEEKEGYMKESNIYLKGHE